MNKRAVIREISERTGIALSDCEKVMYTFEEVLTDELNNSKGKGCTFDTLYKVMSYLSRKRTKKNSTFNA